MIENTDEVGMVNLVKKANFRKEIRKQLISLLFRRWGILFADDLESDSLVKEKYRLAAAAPSESAHKSVVSFTEKMHDARFTVRLRHELSFDA